MTMFLLALPVLPELRITDKGLIDTKNFQFVNYSSKTGLYSTNSNIFQVWLINKETF